MAYEFPRYLSKGQVTTQQPSFLAPESTEGQRLEQVAKVGQVAQEATFKMAQAYSEAQKTQAELNQRTQIDDLLARAEADPDINGYDKYSQENEKIRKDSVSGFKNKFTQGEAAVKANYFSRTADTQLKSLYRKKMIDNQQMNTLMLIDKEINNPQPGSLESIKARLDAQKKLGFINDTDAYKLEQKANADLGVNQINKDLYQAQSPEQVEAVTQKITSGGYEQGGVTIEPDKKKSLLDIAESAKKNTEKKMQAVQIEETAKNRVETISGVASGKIDLQSLDISQISEYDPQLGMALTKAKDFMTNYNPKTPPNEQYVSMAGVLPPNQLAQARSYAKSVNDVFMQNSNEKLGEFVLREMQKRGDGSNSSVKLAAFMQLASLKFESNNPQNKVANEHKSYLDAINAGVKFIQSSNPYLAPQTTGDFIVKNFLSGTTSRKEVMEEAKNTLADHIINRYRSVSKLPSLPNKIVDGEASVEDLQSGLNELSGEKYSGNQSGDQTTND